MSVQTTLDVLGKPVVTFHEKPWRHYQVDGRRVASVTQVIGLLDKSAIKHWAQKEAVRGVAEMVLERGEHDDIFRDPKRLEAAIVGMGREVNAQSFVDLYVDQELTMPWERPSDILASLKRSEKSINARMAEAAARGTAIHAVWEEYAETGKLPNLDHFPPEHRGYLASTAAFIAKHRPKFEAAEEIVGSRVHGFGGRLDFLAYIERGDDYGLLDLKTNAKGRVYGREHFLQVEAYALAGTECGLRIGDFRAVVAVSDHGSFELRRSVATADDFLAVKAAYEACRALERRDKAAMKELGQ